MPCYSPLEAWRGKLNKETGKRGIVWKRKDAVLAQAIQIPCGQCIGCRLERSRQWAIRCMHEADMHNDNCFITLTYSDDKLPSNRSVDVREFQLFMKKLRKAYPAKKIRYFHCGEYGERLGRPHYHACLFGFDFPDKTPWSVRGGYRLYVSDSLTKIWGLGHAVIGDVTFESAAYVARYIMKKVTGDSALEHYVDKSTGELRKPEYISMSRGGRSWNGINLGGIGKTWFKRFKSDVYPSDNIVVRGKLMRPPKYYDSLFESQAGPAFADVKLRRERSKRYVYPLIDRLDGSAVHLVDNTPDRLKVKERIKHISAKLLIRSLEATQ